MSDLPSYVWVLVLVGAVGMSAAACAALYRGAVAAGLGGRGAARVATLAGVAAGGWLLISLLLADAGAYRQDPTVARPWIGVAFLAVSVAALLAARLPAVARILAAPGTAARLVLPQTLRLVGGVFLLVFALGKLPAVFAIPAGLGDLAVGLAAPVVAWRLARGSHRTGAVWFNVLGLLDLAVALSIGFLAGLGPTRLVEVTPSTELVGLLPLALVPTVVVPIAAALHVESLRRLRTAAPPVPARAGRPVPSAG